MAAKDWRADMLDTVRAHIAAAAPDAVEERKWKKPTNPDGVPTWSDHGLICTGETYKDKVKLTSPTAPRWPIREVCSTPASTATPAVPSTSVRTTHSPPPRSRRW